jgi:Domain of unknown function (DUF6883)
MHFQADRTTEVAITHEPRHTVTRRVSVDRRLYQTLLWDFCDAITEGWTTLEVESLPLVVPSKSIWVITVGLVPRDVAASFDGQNEDQDGYLGAVGIDFGNPLQRDLLWDSLIYDLYYDRGTLAHVQGLGALPEERWDVTQPGYWWSDLDFDEVTWHEDRSPEPDEPPAVSPVGLSERGKLTANILRARAAPGHMERVLDQLAARGHRSSVSTRVSGQLPHASLAVIDPRKLTSYVLNPEHETGGAKAALFRDALGITAADWRFLEAQVRQGLLLAPVHRVRSEQYGVQYHADIAVVGKNGVVKAVRTAWIVASDAPPRLVTAYLAPESVDVASLPAPEAPPLLETPPQRQEDWEALFELGDVRGRRAADAVIPTPMFVGGQAYPEGEIGGAVVTVKDARRGLARWLLHTGRADRGYAGGAEIVIFGEVGQSAERAAAYADAFAAVLELNDVSCSVRYFLD